MNLKEYMELMQLLNNVKDRVTYLPKLFPNRPPLTPQVDFELAQKKAMQDIDEAWDKFKQRAKDLNAWTDETRQGQFKV